MSRVTFISLKDELTVPFCNADMLYIEIRCLDYKPIDNKFFCAVKNLGFAKQIFYCFITFNKKDNFDELNDLLNIPIFSQKIIYYNKIFIKI